MIQRFNLTLLLLLLPIFLVAQKPTRVITDADIPVGSHVTFSADTVYILDGMVFVDSLATLTIEAGTVIKAEDGQDIDASGLVITRDAKIFAEGTADRPIIFTSVNDDLQGSLDYTDRGEWAGIVMLGRAPTNNGGDKAVEGVNEIDEARALSMMIWWRRTQPQQGSLDYTEYFVMYRFVIRVSTSVARPVMKYRD
jgi:hypothetical protein